MLDIKFNMTNGILLTLSEKSDQEGHDSSGDFRKRKKITKRKFYNPYMLVSYRKLGWERMK